MLQYAHGVWEERRAEPRDDLSTKLAHATVDGEPLSEVDFGMYFLLLIDAGGDTTRNLVATGMLALLEHPDQLDVPARRSRQPAQHGHRGAPPVGEPGRVHAAHRQAAGGAR